MKCLICNNLCGEDLCFIHKKDYMWDSSINGYRLKKRNRGSRYTAQRYHSTEIQLTKILERIFHECNVHTSYRPIWAKSPKGVLYEFDIFIQEFNLLIEYNGRQHYEYVPFFHKEYNKFEEQQRNDKIKTKMAKDEGYKLMIFKSDEPITKNYVESKLKDKNII